MGQTSSRARRPVLSSQVPEQNQQDVHIEPSPSGNPVARVQTTPATTTLDAEQGNNVVTQSYDHDHQSQEKLTATARTSRRSLLRRSLTGLVKPVTTAVRGRSRAISGNVLHAGHEGEGTVAADAISNAVANEIGDVSGEQKRKEKLRMSWRNSKRWSKSRLLDPINSLREEEVDRKETSSSFPGVNTTIDVGETRGGSVAGATDDVASTSRVEVKPALKGMETLKGKERENLGGGSEPENHMPVPDSGSEENRITLGDTAKANSSAAATPTMTNNSSQIPEDILRAPHVHPIPLPACISESSSLSPSAASTPSTMDHSVNTHGNHQQWEGSSTNHHRRYRREFSPIGLSALPPMSMTPLPRAMIPPFVPLSPSAAPRPVTTRQRAGVATGNNSNHNNNRQFPPPGTLVVVQGIVHTTDVSRSDGVQSNSNHADGETTATGGIGSNDISTNSTQVENNDDEVGMRRGRSQQSSSSAVDRLSALLGREGGSSLSMDESVGENGAEVSAPGIQLSEEATSREQREREPQQSQLSSSEQARSTSIISSNSIDVLGTLLRSVFPF